MAPHYPRLRVLQGQEDKANGTVDCTTLHTIEAALQGSIMSPDALSHAARVGHDPPELARIIMDKGPDYFESPPTPTQYCNLYPLRLVATPDAPRVGHKRV
jgi:hypothetical protein